MEVDPVTESAVRFSFSVADAALALASFSAACMAVSEFTPRFWLQSCVFVALNALSSLVCSWRAWAAWSRFRSPARELAWTLCLMGFGLLCITFGRTLWRDRYIKDRETLDNLAALRLRLKAYKKRTGSFPDVLAPELLRGKLGSQVMAVPPEHWQASWAVRYSAAADDSGGWLYDSDRRDPDFGRLSVNCTHVDRGSRTIWSAY